MRSGFLLPFLPILLALLPAPAFPGEPWVFLGELTSLKTGMTGKLSLNLETLRRRGNYYEIWERLVYENDPGGPAGENQVEEQPEEQPEEPAAEQSGEEPKVQLGEQVEEQPGEQAEEQFEQQSNEPPKAQPRLQARSANARHTLWAIRCGRGAIAKVTERVGESVEPRESALRFYLPLPDSAGAAVIEVACAEVRRQAAEKRAEAIRNGTAKARPVLQTRLDYPPTFLDDADYDDGDE